MKTWSHKKSKRKEFDDDVREVEERRNTPDLVEEDNVMGE